MLLLHNLKQHRSFSLFKPYIIFFIGLLTSLACMTVVLTVDTIKSVKNVFETRNYVHRWVISNIVSETNLLMFSCRSVSGFRSVSTYVNKLLQYQKQPHQQYKVNPQYQ